MSSQEKRLDQLNDKDLEKHWTEKASKVLLNRKIVKVGYLSESDTDSYGWYKRPITFWLDDGTWIQAQMDDEGNDGGVLFFAKNQKDQGVLPVL